MWVCQHDLRNSTLPVAIFGKKEKTHPFCCVFGEKCTLDVGTPAVPYHDIGSIPPPWDGMGVDTGCQEATSANLLKQEGSEIIVSMVFENEASPPHRHKL